MPIKQILELPVSNEAKKKYIPVNTVLGPMGKIQITDNYQFHEIVHNASIHKDLTIGSDDYWKSGELAALALLEKVNQFLFADYMENFDNVALKGTLSQLNEKYGPKKIDWILKSYCSLFIPDGINIDLDKTVDNSPLRELLLQEILLLKISNNNPAAGKYRDLFNDTTLNSSSEYTPVFYSILSHFDELPPYGPYGGNVIRMIMEPSQKHPYSLLDQINYIRENWPHVSKALHLLLMTGIDLIREENKTPFTGPGPIEVPVYQSDDDNANFSPDSNWMPEVVLLAKNTLVWLSQLSSQYNKNISTLDAIPDEELDLLAKRGINCLWLIGLWNRSEASKEIKRKCGNKDAVSSAYSLFSYDISWDLGGWDALENLKSRCMARGIRLASDMVPNHTGIDSEWVRNRPDLFIQSNTPPFPSYSYYGPDLCSDPGVSIYLEDHYYDKTDAAVTFKRVDRQSGEERFIYHGNDGTAMPWNDTAQLDFLKREVREAVIEQILHVARNFPVIRFDAAMTLAKKHIQRLWYPEPGQGGDIPSRSFYSMTKEEFDKAIGREFWKDVVIRVAEEAPETLLLAEAFWMMEGYFVRNLGMHRVYNSAFMNMTKNEMNREYREMIKNTLNFDRKILKRFVNFMNNPDEETAAVQFGKGDKYFGVLTMMLTMPGLPMIGHGQIEGLQEKYGMEFTKPLSDELPDKDLIKRHEREIFPLIKMRKFFVSANRFRLYDLICENGEINENVFAYTNSYGTEKVLILYNNSIESATGYFKESVPYLDSNNKSASFSTTALSDALGLSPDRDSYCSLHEFKSGLTYVLKSSDFCDRGFSVELNGYECRVYTQIKEEKNSQSNRLAAISENLDGRGSADLDREYRAVVFKPLYSLLNKLITRDLIRELNIENSSLHKIAKDRKELLTEIFETIKSFSSGTGDSTSICMETIRSIKFMDPSKFEKNTSDLREYCLFRYDLTKKLAVFLFSIFQNFGTVVSRRDRKRVNRNIMDQWMIVKYLQDILRDLNFSEKNIDSIVSELRFFTNSYDREDPCFSEPLSLQTLDKLNELGDFRRFLGLNSYNGTLWFSKERFESFLWWASYFSLRESAASMHNIINESISNWQTASRESMYDFNRFIHLIRKK